MRYFIVLVLTLLFSCTNDSEKRENNYTSEQVSQKKNLIQEVMNVHDAAMPWLDVIHKLKTELESKIAETKESQNDSLTQKYTKALADLEKADEAMMGWMRTYTEPDDTVQFQTAIEYLNIEKENIVKVKIQMENCMKNAKMLLQK